MNRKELIEEIAYRLMTIRKARQFTRAKMANAIGIGDSSYYKNENAKTAPDVGTFRKISENLDVSLDWLITGRGEMDYKGPLPILEVEQLSERETPMGEAKLSSDVKELLEHMEQIPLLRFEVLTLFHKFKQDQKELVMESMNSVVENAAQG